MLKLILLNLAVILLGKYLGRAWSLGFLGLMILGIIYVHGYVLPRKGINGLTGEPKRKYYEMRGWTRFLDHEDDENGDEQVS